MSGFLKKLGLVEDVDNGRSDLSVDEIIAQNNELLDQSNFSVEVPSDIDTSELVTAEEVYGKFGLNDMEKSIFRVEEFRNTLPDSLPTQVQRETVLKVLATSHLEIEQLKEDAVKRLDSLGATLDAIKEESDRIVNESKEKIKNLEEEIDALKQSINDRQKLQEDQEKLTIEEIKKIEGILDFIHTSE